MFETDAAGESVEVTDLDAAGLLAVLELCRRHHRCKTSGRWRYRRRPDGTYQWHGPHGRTYLVTPHGTIQLTTN